MKYFFPRDPGPLTLSGARLTAPSDEPGRLLEASIAGRLLASDLTMGAARTHQVALELRCQLGLAEPPETSWPDDFADTNPLVSAMGRLTDGELQGDRVVLKALQFAREVRVELDSWPPMLIAVLIPRYDFGWERGDVLFVRFLAQALQPSRHKLLLVATPPHAIPTPPDWIIEWSVDTLSRSHTAVDPMWGLIPGIVTPDIVGAMVGIARGGPGYPVPGGCFLIPPEVRRDPSFIESACWDSIATQVQMPLWLAAYAMSRSSAECVNPVFLTMQSFHEFRIGGASEMVLRLLERATAAPQAPLERGSSQVLLQGLRIVAERFDAAARLADPEPGLPPLVRGLLLMTKGWALTMLGRPLGAEAFLAEARYLLRNSPWQEEYLSLLNISALTRLNLGDAAGAKAFEECISSELTALPTGGWQIRYVNQLNLARLERRRGNLQAAEQHYNCAFATTQGSRSESDSVYMHVCGARLAEQSNRHHDALRSWFAVALHWVASIAPEAVGSRVIAAILDRTPHRSDAVLDDVAAAILAKLVALATAAGHGRTTDGLAGADATTAPTFAVASELPLDTPSRAWTALRGFGWWVLEGEVAMSPSIESPMNRLLRSALGRLLDPAVRTKNGSVIVVDDQLGRGLPSSRTELICVCLRLGIPALLLEGRRMNFDTNTRSALEDRLRVCRGVAVDRLETVPDGALVTFKRYRAPLKISPPLAYLVQAIGQDSVSVERLRAEAAEFPFLEILRALERERIIDLIAPPEEDLVRMAEPST